MLHVIVYSDATLTEWTCQALFLEFYSQAT